MPPRLMAASSPAVLSSHAWFQWGLTSGYGSNTPPVAVGSGTIPVSVTNRLTPLRTGRHLPLPDHRHQ